MVDRDSSREPPYERIARYYDAIYEAKGRDPVAEVQTLAAHWCADGLTAEKRTILDVGCGTGRILLGLKEQGLDVVGLDSSPEMLCQCRQKLSANQLEAELYEGDMRSFDLKRSFSTILIPGFSIQL